MWDFVPPDKDFDRRLETEGDRLWSRLKRIEDQVYRRQVDVMSEHARRAGGGRDRTGPLVRVMPGCCTSVDEFRTAAQLLRDLVRIWRGLQGWTDWDDVSAQWESLFRPSAEVGQPWPTPQQGALLLTRALNNSLVSFHVRLELPREGLQAAEGVPTPSLWSALCLQFANHMIENRRDPGRGVIKECQNESCHNLFVLQDDPGGPGQHRTRGEIKYCSNTCVQTAKKRRYRQANREKASRGAQGGEA